MTDLLIEPYRPGDELEMLRLFRKVFGASRSLEHWHWQFRDNPYGGPFITLARRASDRHVVGQHVIMPFMLNVKGTAVLAGQSLDLAVHPDHRRKGVFENTARDCYARCAEAGVRALVAFPNESSFPGFVRTLGWARLVVPTRYSLRVGWAGGLDKLRVPRIVIAALDWPVRSIGLRRTRVRRAALGDVVSRWSRVAPENADELWNAIRSHEALSIWKDRRYLAWRYDANPSHEFRYLLLEQSGVPVALAVMTVVGRKALICELMVRGREAALGRRLVSEACEALAREPIDRLEFLGHDSGFFGEILAGFRAQPALGNIYVGRALGSDGLGAVLSGEENWTLSYGDGDFV